MAGERHGWSSFPGQAVHRCGHGSERPVPSAEAPNDLASGSHCTKPPTGGDRSGDSADTSSSGSAYQALWSVFLQSGHSSSLRGDSKAKCRTRSSQREPDNSLRDKSTIIGGWVRPLTSAFYQNMRAKLKSPRDDVRMAQGKDGTSAALEYDPETVPALAFVRPRRTALNKNKGNVAMGARLGPVVLLWGLKSSLQNARHSVRCVQ